MARREKPPIRTRQIHGGELGLPLVTALGTVRTHSVERIAWHSHKDYEFLFILEGATTYEFRDRPSVGLRGGHFLLVPPGLVHRGAHDVRMPSVMCGILFHPERRQASRNTIFAREDLQRIGDLLQGIPLTPWTLHRELRRVVVRMLEEAEAFISGQQDVATRISLRGTACLALLEATRQLASPSRAGATEVVAAAEAYLIDHLADPVRISDLVRHLGLSRARVFDLFKKTTGLTPNDYLVRQRVERGRQLLATTERSVTDIAIAVGFSSSQYFSNVFWKYTGMRPTEYREKYSTISASGTTEGG